jgi:hypothetical protein
MTTDSRRTSRWVAAAVGWLARLRTGALTVAGFALIAVAGWLVTPALGLALGGVALLILEGLTDT